MNASNLKKNLICKMCGEAYSTKATLINHQKCIHNIGSIKKPECLFCKKLLKSPSDLKVHLRTHTKENPFFCNLCPQECSEKQNLQKHLQIHNPSRIKCFKCDLCSKRFYTDGDKKRHLKSHLLEKPHKCSDCGKEFQTKQRLTNHMLVHTKEKPFQCEVCKKGFSQSGHLRRHMLIHSGKNTFSCEICKKVFIRTEDLTTHMRVHTGEKPFSCSNCNLKFSTGSNLLRHQKRKH